VTVIQLVFLLGDLCEQDASVVYALHYLSI